MLQTIRSINFIEHVKTYVQLLAITAIIKHLEHVKLSPITTH